MRFAMEHILEGLHQIGPAGIRANATEGAHFSRVRQVEGIRLDVQHEHARGWPKEKDLAENVEPVITRNTDIEDDQVPRLPGDLLQGFASRSGLPEEDIAVLLSKHLLQPLTNKQMMVHDENSERCHVSAPVRCRR